MSDATTATTEDWDTTLAVNGRGTFLCYKYAAQEMMSRGTKGRIIGASSVAGKRGSWESRLARLL